MAEGDISLKTTAGSRGCAAFLWLGTAWFLLGSMCDSEGSAASPTQSRVAVTALVFSPDGSRLVSSGARELEIWRTASLEKVGAVSCDLSKFGSLRFAPNGRVLVVAGGDPGRQGTVRVLRWPEREWISETGEHGDVVHRAECDGTGTSWVTASADGRLGLWKMSAEGKLSSSSLWTAHKGPVFSAVFLGEGRWILSAGADRSLKVWRSEDGMLVRSLNYHTEPIQSLELMDPGTRGVRVAPSASRPARIGRSGCGSLKSDGWCGLSGATRAPSLRWLRPRAPSPFLREDPKACSAGLRLAAIASWERGRFTTTGFLPLRPVPTANGWLRATLRGGFGSMKSRSFRE